MELSDCPHCHVTMQVGQSVYKTEEGDTDCEYYYYCDKCGADYQ